jgi:hypothetical protein
MPENERKQSASNVDATVFGFARVDRALCNAIPKIDVSNVRKIAACHATGRPTAFLCYRRTVVDAKPALCTFEALNYSATVYRSR